jgi:hypothetical protein
MDPARFGSDMDIFAALKKCCQIGSETLNFIKC